MRIFCSSLKSLLKKNRYNVSFNLGLPRYGKPRLKALIDGIWAQTAVLQCVVYFQTGLDHTALKEGCKQQAKHVFFLGGGGGMLVWHIK